MLHLPQLRRKFYDHFGSSAEKLEIYFAPGRVCLIGEHIDYNGGLVLPAAISLGIYGVFRKDDSNELKMISSLDSTKVTLNLETEIVFDEKAKWANYPAGVIKYLKEMGLKIPGGELLFESNLPVGAGLSSSAAIEVLTGFIVSSTNDNPVMDGTELAKLCQKVENEFIGVQCGIMDQFAVAMGKRNQAMILNCNTVLLCEHIPFDLGKYSMVIFNSNKKRELTDSLFNQRVSECNDALKAINKYQQIENLADADEDAVNKYVVNPIAKKRALHVVQENKRVGKAGEALKAGDVEKFGELLFQSHHSLKHQYEVTGLELDAIEEAARNHPACIGAKMSGAGFGGCAFAIAKQTEIEGFVKYVLDSYRNKTGLQAFHHFVEIDDGVRKLE